jgi:hypothetical protein
MKISATALLVSVAICAAIACSPNRPIKTVDLKMRSSGEFELDHRIVKSENLTTELMALANTQSKVCIAIMAPISDHELPILVSEIQKAGISCIGELGEPR